MQVIAIVTDRLSDCAVIRDLHSAASRGVAVYIILNQRSLQETFKIKKLRHPVSRLRIMLREETRMKKLEAIINNPWRATAFPPSQPPFAHLGAPLSLFAAS